MVAVQAFLMMLGFRDIGFILILTTIYVAVVSIKNIQWKLMDVLIVLFILYSLFSYLFSDYPLSLFYYGVKTQIIPILFYFIARGKYISKIEFINNMFYPLLVVYLFAVILYFFPPGFYTEFKMGNISENVSVKMLHEISRMSSFWSHPYFVGYSSVFVIVSSLINIIVYKNTSKLYIWMLFLALFCQIFSQMRVCLAFSFLFFFYITLYSYRHKLRASKILFRIWLSLIIIVITVVFIIFTYLDSSFIEYILNRSIDSDENIITARFGLFDGFTSKISILGEGLGKYGHAALLINQPSIADCEYIRLPVELGLMGALIYFIIICKSIINGLKIKYIYFYETSVILFFLVAMIGAAPLEMPGQQPFMLWFCVGTIANNKLR